jgi:hypothetical protein
MPLINDGRPGSCDGYKNAAEFDVTVAVILCEAAWKD